MADLLGGLWLVHTEPLRLSRDETGNTDVSFTVSAGGVLTIAPDGAEIDITGDLVVSDDLTVTDTSTLTGNVGIGTAVSVAARLLLGAGAASYVPLQLTSGTVKTVAVAGGIEFNTDDFFATITTGAARKGIVLDNGSRLTSGGIPVATTNGRLIDGPAYSGGIITGSVSGSAATLTTTRTIWGQNFNGSANVSGALSGATTIQTSGNVGIGMAPGAAYKLEIAAAAPGIRLNAAADTSMLIVCNNSTTATYGFENAAGDHTWYMQFSDSGTGVFKIIERLPANVTRINIAAGGAFTYTGTTFDVNAVFAALAHVYPGGVETGVITLSGGSASNVGALMNLYGGSHPTKPYIIEFAKDTTIVGSWDVSGKILTLTSDLKFPDATHDIGKTGAARPRDGFFSRNFEIGGTLLVTGVTTHSAPTRLKNYTVATLPAGVQGYVAYVTDALAPAFLTAIVGGGAVVTPVFYDGTNWVAI